MTTGQRGQVIVTAPIETTGAEAGAPPESVLSGAKKSQIEGRSLSQIAWTRFKRDKVAVAGGIVVILLVLMAVLAKPIEWIFGLDPTSSTRTSSTLRCWRRRAPGAA